MSAYIGKSQLLEWVNDVLDLEVKSIEELASGAVFCQILDAYVEGAVNVRGVNFHAKTEQECFRNYKVLQKAFSHEELQVDKDLDVYKMAKGSSAELLSTLQYLYKLTSKRSVREGYDPRERRARMLHGGSHGPAMSNVLTREKNWKTSVKPAGSRFGKGSHSPTALSASSGAASRGALSGRGSLAEDSERHVTSPTSSSPSTASRQRSSLGRVRGVPGSRLSIPAGAATAAANQGSAHVLPGVDAALNGQMSSGSSRGAENARPATAGGLARARQSTAARPRTAGYGRRGERPQDRLMATMDGYPDAAALASGDAGSLLVAPAPSLRNAMDSAKQAVAGLVRSLPLLKQLKEEVGCEGLDGYMHRGKLRSLRDVMTTLARHTSLLLRDLYTQAQQQDDLESRDRARAVEKSLAELDGAVNVLEGLCSQIDRVEAVYTVPMLARPTDLRSETVKEMKQLDVLLKAVGMAQTSLAPLHCAIGVTANIVQAPSSAADGSGQEAILTTARDLQKQTSEFVISSHSRAFKVGDFQIRRLRNGDIYKGRYQMGKKSGDGVYAFVNGDAYEGEFQDDRMQGHGVYTFAHQGRFEGSWAKAVYEGGGMETFSKGSAYQGSYVQGMRAGFGVCRYYNGDYYEGMWSAGLREGRGMQQCTDDSNYVGDYVRGKRHGYGVYSFPNGDRYLGQYEDDIPHGHGTYLFAGGQKYEGQWLRGKKHGWCQYTIETGEQYAGEWDRGKPKWVQALALESEEEALSTEVRQRLQRASEATGHALEAARTATGRAQEHWEPGGELQEGLRCACADAEKAAALAQAGRQRALLMASKLEQMASKHGGPDWADITPGTAAAAKPT